MAMFLVAFLVMALIIAAMAVGVIFSNKPIKGSCGGLNQIGMKESCSICGGDDDECKKEQERQAKLAHNTDLAYDASKK